MTPNERLAAYETALAGLDERKYNNVCCYLERPVMEYYEFFKQRPYGKAIDKPWWTMTWQGMAARRRALLRAIELVKLINQ